MTSPQQSISFWLAHSSLQLVLRLWPEETRHWGQAHAAELDEIEKPFEALRWALGGLMLRPTRHGSPTWTALFALHAMTAISTVIGNSPAKSGITILTSRHP